MDDNRPKTGPTAAIRQMASVMWQTYVALIAAGFSERQALTILGEVLRGSMGKGQSDG